MKKCKYWRFYKAIRPPQCGCDFCEAKWEAKNKSLKKKTMVTADCPDPSECEEGCIGYCSEVDDLTEDVVDFISRNS
jgi:hypothetical protein